METGRPSLVGGCFPGAVVSEMEPVLPSKLPDPKGGKCA